MMTTLKCSFSVFLLILVPIYWIAYGPSNFLWFSDVALITSFLALMTGSRLLGSMAAVGGFVLESIWILDFILLFFDIHLLSLTDYMFDPSLNLGLRALSLFHLTLVPMFVFLIYRFGYDRRAWIFQSILVWMVLLLTWLLSEPAENINWVFCYKQISWLQNHPLTYLTGLGLSLTALFRVTQGSILLIIDRQKESEMEEAALSPSVFSEE